MSYLARLKAEQFEKVVTLGTDKGDKSPSVSFVSSHCERFSDQETHYRWRVRNPDGSEFEFLALPEQSSRQVEARYPGATVWPIVRAPQHATSEQAIELRDLVASIFAAASRAERAEVFAVACADPGAALTSFRLLGGMP